MDEENSKRPSFRFRVDLVEEEEDGPEAGPEPEPRSPGVVSFDNAAYYKDEDGGGTSSPTRKDTTTDYNDDRKISVLSQYYKSYGNVQTMDRPPNIYNYRNRHSVNGLEGSSAARATLAELRAANLIAEEETTIESLDLRLDEPGGAEGSERRGSARLQQFPKPSGVQPVKFGWIQGVLIRCVLNIVGVMLYLRLSWMTGQAGVGLASAIVLLSSLVTCITSLSMCAICTNGEIKAGGAYFMISRSMGAEFGGSIGVVFTLANVLGAAMHCVGFAEAFRDVLAESGACMVDCALMDLRIIGWATASLLMVVVFVGVSFEAKAQLVFLVILAASLVNYWAGTVIPPSEADRAKGLTGYSWTTLADNFLPHFRSGETFFTLLGVYFPSATGIMAGANMSGDLKDPSGAIPRGTLLAILLTTLLYLSVVWTTGSTCARYATGRPADLGHDNLTRCAPPPDGPGAGCQYGLMSYYHVMELDSGYRYVVTAGIFAATLSSALASLVSAPKIFQALGRDRLYPFTGSLSRGFGRADDPRLAYGITWLVVLAVIGLGDLNMIAPYVSNFFLASYCLVNYASFAASFSESPGFRPSFRYYNMWVSLLGAVLCVAMMFVINWIAAVVTMAFVFLLYVFVWYRKPEVNWGSSSQAAVYKAALQKVHKLQTVEEHVKNYRPQVLVLSGNPVARPSLVDFAANITKDISLLVCGHVVVGAPTGCLLRSLRTLDKQVTRWMRKRKVKAFYRPLAAPNLLSGAQALTQLCGLSRLRPNILMMGYKADWNKDGAVEAAVEYFRVINCAFESHMGIGILRIQGGLDFSDPMKALAMPVPVPAPVQEVVDMQQLGLDTSGGSVAPSAAPSRRGSVDYLDAPPPPRLTDSSRPSLASIAQLSISARTDKAAAGGGGKGARGANNQGGQAPLSVTKDQADLVSAINRFRVREKRAVIDVWWLFDDGGLTMLVPHMLTLPKSYLEGAKLRVFTVASRKSAIEQEQRGMITLLNKFRIDYEDVFLIPDITRKPTRDTRRQFDRLIEPFKTTVADHQYALSDMDLAVMQQKTHRQLRTRELLLEHSSGASLIVMTLPVPREGATSPFLYLAWLEMLTRDLPPVLLLRGDQQSVLTFYS